MFVFICIVHCVILLFHCNISDLSCVTGFVVSLNVVVNYTWTKIKWTLSYS